MENVKVLSGAGLLFKAYPNDVGYDIILVTDLLIKAHSTTTYNTTIKLDMRGTNTHAFCVVRSSLARKGLIVSHAIVDTDYIGAIHLICHNISTSDMSFKKGIRIASLILAINAPPLKNIKTQLKLKRGEKWSGSSNFENVL